MFGIEVHSTFYLVGSSNFTVTWQINKTWISSTSIQQVLSAWNVFFEHNHSANRSCYNMLCKLVCRWTQAEVWNQIIPRYGCEPNQANEGGQSPDYLAEQQGSWRTKTWRTSWRIEWHNEGEPGKGNAGDWYFEKENYTAAWTEHGRGDSCQMLMNLFLG